MYEAQGVRQVRRYILRAIWKNQNYGAVEEPLCINGKTQRVGRALPKMDRSLWVQCKYCQNEINIVNADSIIVDYNNSRLKRRLNKVALKREAKKKKHLRFCVFGV